LKNFPGVIPPGPPLKGREERKGRMEGERRGLGIQMGRNGVVWDSGIGKERKGWN
jgi:hypothetical protein